MSILMLRQIKSRSCKYPKKERSINLLAEIKSIDGEAETELNTPGRKPHLHAPYNSL